MTGLIKWWKSVGHAARGLSVAWRNEANFRWHLLIMIISAVLAVYLDFPTPSWIILVLIWGMVIATELINTAFEKLADFIHPENDPRIGRVKDLAAAAVLVVAVTAAVAGVMLFLPAIVDRLGGK